LSEVKPSFSDVFLIFLI